jgi:ArsR family transcriptional regulator
MRDLVKVLKAAGDKNRLRILKMLQHKNMCVCELAAALGIAQPSVSRHMSLLKDAGLVQDRRDGQWIDYCLCEEKINQYAPMLLKQIKQWINDDTTIREDIKKIHTLCRQEICKKSTER